GVLVLHDLAPLLLELVEQLLPVTVVDLRGLGQGVFADVLGRRQVVREEGERDQAADDRQPDERDQESDQDRREDRDLATQAVPLRPAVLVRSAPERMIARRRARDASNSKL